MAIAISHLFLLIASEGGAPWYNYPGFEFWKFLNLGLFIGILWFLHRKFGRPITEALRMRKEEIKRQLARAHEERDMALRQLAQVETRIEGLQSEVEAIREKAKAEAKAENERIKEATETEIAKVKLSAQREIEVAGKTALAELKRFASEQSIKNATEVIQQNINPDDEARFLRLRNRKPGDIGDIGEIGGPAV